MNERFVKIGRSYVRRPQAVPYHATWQDHARLMAEVVIDTVVFLSLLLGIPFLLFLVAG